MDVLKGRRILLGVTGGVSAYKAIEVLRLLIKAGATVDVVMTPAATRFVAPASFRALSGRPVLVDLFALPGDWEVDRATMPHLDVAEGAELAIVAPATANTLAKMALGLADNALLTALLSVTAPVIVAPAMDSDMWRHPATQENIRRLKERGVVVVGPEEGLLARMNVGPGRLSDPEKIVAAAAAELARRRREGGAPLDLAGRTILVTAGGTREAIDPVRYIGNRSSGKMGYALAAAAARRGAKVILVSAPTALAPPAGCELVRVESALEMKAAVEARQAECDAFIMAAAVADFRPEHAAPAKVKKGERDSWEIRLVRNPDIAAAIGAAKRPDQVLVVFAAETEALLEHAAAKLRAKNADLVVANDVTKPGSGFEVDTNEVTLLHRDGRRQALPLLTKDQVAEAVIEQVACLLAARP